MYENANKIRAVQNNTPSNDKEDISDHEVKISGIPHTKDEFMSQTENEINQINSVSNNLKMKVDIKDFHHIGKKKHNSSRPRSSILRFHSILDARLTLAKAYQLKTFNKPIFIHRSLSTTDQQLMGK